MTPKPPEDPYWLGASTWSLLLGVTLGAGAVLAVAYFWLDRAWDSLTWLVGLLD